MENHPLREVAGTTVLRRRIGIKYLLRKWTGGVASKRYADWRLRDNAFDTNATNSPWRNRPTLREHGVDRLRSN